MSQTILPVTGRSVSVLFLMLLALAIPATSAPRLVVLGFDGADANLTKRYMAEGRLPHLSALAEEGSFSALMPTNPPQTPVSWSTFATGLNPGRTEIFDFLRRVPGSYRPAFCAFDTMHRKQLLFGERNGLVLGALGAGLGVPALLFALSLRLRRKKGASDASFLRRLGVLGLTLSLLGAAGGAFLGEVMLPATVPDPLNKRQGQTFWSLAGEAGLKSRVLRVPLTFPADQQSGLEMISGMGVPDLRATVGEPTVFTTRRGLSGGEFNIAIVELELQAGEAKAILEGPRNVLFPDSEGSYNGPRIPLEIRFEDLGEGRVRVDAGDRSSTLAPGEWSAWHAVDYSLSALAKVHGMTRFYNQSLSAAEGQDPVLEVLASPINFHSDEVAGLRWSAPSDYGPSLSRALGPFKTQGWAIDTWTVSEGLTSEQQSLEDAQYTEAQYTEMMKLELVSDEIDLYVQVFAFTDRIQHIFLRHADPTHPMYDAALARRYQDTVQECYERMDEIVGQARALLPADTQLIVLSDHGFTQFRRGLNLNRWLVEEGYMVLNQDPCLGGAAAGRTLDDLFGDQKRIFEDVDWSRTRAYALGLGNVYVNLLGREPEGTVRPGREYRELVADIASGLEQLVDPETGEKPVRKAWHRDELYSGYDAELIPDMRIGNAPGYRVSWGGSLGDVPCELLEDNSKTWGADHCSLAPEVVQGILFSNRALSDEKPDMADLFPTILELLGLPLPEDLDGHSLL